LAHGGHVVRFSGTKFAAKSCGGIAEHASACETAKPDTKQVPGFSFSSPASIYGSISRGGDVPAARSDALQAVSMLQ